MKQITTESYKIFSTLRYFCCALIVVQSSSTNNNKKQTNKHKLKLEYKTNVRWKIGEGRGGKKPKSQKEEREKKRDRTEFCQ